MNYSELVQAITIRAAQSTAAQGYALPTDFANYLPRILTYAEGRIYREMTLLATRAQDASLVFTGATRSLNLANASTIIIVPEGLSVVTPAGSAPGAGTRLLFVEASLDLIDTVWPQESLTADPSTVEGRYWAMRDDHTMVVCPTPNATFTAEITGLFQPAPISNSNPTTYLSLTYPDLLLEACMIGTYAFSREWSAQAEDPKTALSAEEQYKALRESAIAQEQRLRGAGAGWSPNLPTPLAKPQRT